MSDYLYQFDCYKDGSLREIELKKIESARRIANVIYQRGISHLFDCEQYALNNEEFRNMVTDCLESLKAGIPWPPRYYVKHIVLDKPELKYETLVKTYCELYEFVLIDFLCSGISNNSHFACVLAEQLNLKYRCLGIPVEQWHEYKNLPDYKGE